MSATPMLAREAVRDGSPKHPLMLAYSTPLVRYTEVSS